MPQARFHTFCGLAFAAAVIVLATGCREASANGPATVSPGALLAAISNGEWARAEKLLAAGADPNEVNRYGDSALIWAVHRQQLGLATHLLKRGAAIDYRGTYGKTALHWSCSVPGDTRLTTLLIEAGASLDIQDAQGATPLIAATRLGSIAAVRVLLAAGADSSLADNQGRTPLQLAVEKQSSALVATLVEGGTAPDDGALRAAVARNLTGLFQQKAILAKFPDIGRRIEALYQEVETNRGDREHIDLATLTRRVHELINLERGRRGLKPLLFDDRLARLAEAHSRDMGRRHFFEHVNPDGLDPTARARAAGIPTRGPIDKNTYKVGIGENIHMRKAYSGSQITTDKGVRYVTYHWLSQQELAKAAVKSWMDSPPHRENILNPIYEKAGVGIAQTGDDELYFTQDFW